jgi:hypothetical protein
MLIRRIDGKPSGQLKQFKKFCDAQLSLAEDASQHRLRQIEPIVARNCDVQMRLPWMPKLSVAAGLMMNQEACAEQSPQNTPRL